MSGKVLPFRPQSPGTHPPAVALDEWWSMPMNDRDRSRMVKHLRHAWAFALYAGDYSTQRAIGHIIDNLPAYPSPPED